MLVEATVCTFRWQRMLWTGWHAAIEAIAKAERITSFYARRVPRLMREATRHRTPAEAMKVFPVKWSEQASDRETSPWSRVALGNSDSAATDGFMHIKELYRQYLHDEVIFEAITFEEFVEAVRNLPLDPLWKELFPAEQAWVGQLLVARVDVRTNGLELHLRTQGLGQMVHELGGIGVRRAA